jgi:outer membrane protein OmpA-like peptidoglycan-associated protein
MVNSGKDTVVIRDLRNGGPDDGQFRVVTEKTYKIAPMDTLKALLRFQPAMRGKTTTRLGFSTPDESYQVILLGEGVAPREIVLTGTTRSSADSIPVEAVVRNTDLESDRKINEVKTGTDGKFQFRLKADRNYGIMAEKDGFISASINVDLSEKAGDGTLTKDIYLTPIRPGAVIRFNCIFFEFDQATLLPGSQADLKRMLEIIRKYKFNSFEIHGHTDSEGSESYNLALSKARATTVMNYLIQNGASKEKLSIRYFGESQPVATNATEEGRALNRRVELKIVD